MNQTGNTNFYNSNAKVSVLYDTSVISFPSCFAFISCSGIICRQRKIHKENPYAWERKIWYPGKEILPLFPCTEGGYWKREKHQEKIKTHE